MAKQTSGNGLNKAGQVVTIVTCCAAVILLQSWLIGTLHVHPLVAGLVVLCVVGVFAGVGYASFRMKRSSAEAADVRTVEPIMASYAETHAKKQLARDYDEWARDTHTLEARAEFLRRMVLALADDGHNFEARQRLGELEGLVGGNAGYGETLAELEGHIAASAAAKRSGDAAEPQDD